jgi:hypothetical protein
MAVEIVCDLTTDAFMRALARIASLVFSQCIISWTSTVEWKDILPLVAEV